MNFLYVGIGIVIGFFLGVLACGQKIPEAPANVSDTEIYQLALEGKKIQAIKWYRSKYKVGLKEAKEAVEKMVAR